MTKRLVTHRVLPGLLVGLLYLGAGWLLSGQAAEVPEAAAPARVSSPPARTAAPAARPGVSPARAVPPPAPPDTASLSPAATSLEEELAAYVADLDGTYGVAIGGPADGQEVLINADRIFPSASLYKVLVMYRVYQFIDRGDLSPDTRITFLAEDLVESESGDGLSPGDVISVGEAVEWMITFSSNPAAYALARQVGGWNGVLAAASELGMMDTTWDGETFVTTAADMLRFFEVLGSRAMISPEASDQMTAVLLLQKINDRLPAGLPPGTKVAHKTGELPEIRHDAGVVFTDGGHYAIVIMSEGIDPPKAAAAQADISRVVFDRLGG